ALSDLIPFPSLPFYPDLQVACGAFPGESDLVPTAKPIRIDTRVTVSPQTHFVVRASGESMSAGETPINDADLVLCEWLRGARAADVEGKIILVQGPEGAALKIPRRENGGWRLESTNPEYPSIDVQAGEALEPLARFVEVATEAHALIPWAQYERNAILAAFGKKPNRVYQVGHIDLTVDGQEHTILLVTLRKDEQAEEKYRYEDEFVSPGEFQWESQDSTSADSKRGRSILDQVKTKRKIHLFVRYRSKQSFTYCGLLEYTRHEREKPLRVWFRLRQPLPAGLWRAWGRE
ncbi:MAG: DUF3427 domain-containing protein, partial [Polyangiaceae bacterium]